MEKNSIVVFKDGALELEVNVNLEQDTVWLSRNQIAVLFDRDVKTIGKHIKNALMEELDDSTVAKFATVQKEGKRDILRQIEYYNLDMIISVGYRVKSNKGIIFRKWAAKILKDYMIQGYAVNEKRIEKLNKTITLQSKIIAGSIGAEESEVLKVVNQYTEALNLLDDYDHKRLMKPEGTSLIYELTYEDCREFIDNMDYGNTSAVFGVEKEKDKLNGILAAVYQHVFGQEVYPSLEEKAANLLYFLIKDHPFADGCKRIGAALFLEFLNRNHALLNKKGEKRISDSALVAITLLIAESNPEEKEVLVSLVMMFIQERDCDR